MSRCAMLGRRMAIASRGMHAAMPAPMPALPAAAMAASHSAVRLMHSHAALSAPRVSQPLRAPAAAATPADDDSTPFAAAEAATAEQSFPMLEGAEEGEASPTFIKQQTRAWHLFDARGQVVGRMAGRIATLLQGKHKPSFTPWLDNGDAVVVLNARHLVFTGKKWQNKLYRYHTGYVGGLKEIPAERWRDRHSDRILRHAVAGMIKKNKLKVPRLARLKIYPGLLHPHQAQFPFDTIAHVPALKAQREAEIAELEAEKQYERDAVKLAEVGATGGAPQTALEARRARDAEARGKKKKVATVNSMSSPPAGTDDGTQPENAEIRAAITKDREQRKGKPIVRL